MDDGHEHRRTQALGEMFSVRMGFELREEKSGDAFAILKPP
jgi:hypothetical protein